MPELDGVTPASQLFEEAKAKKLARKEARKLKQQPKPDLPLTEQEQAHWSDLDTKLSAIKDQGNAKFSQKLYADAIDLFTQGIDVYERCCGAVGE